MTRRHLAAVLLLVPVLAACSSNAPAKPGNVEIINRADYTGADPWPLTVDQVIAGCRDGRVSFQAGRAPQEYAVSPQRGDGTASLDLITTRQAGAPDGMMSVAGLLAQAQKLC